MTATTEPAYDRGQRPAQPGEHCTCGRPATVVFVTERFGDVGYCGHNAGGATSELAARP